MDNADKLRVLLQHWIDHNAGHVAEFEKWQQTMAEEGQDKTATSLGDAIKQMDKVSDILTQTLDECGGPLNGGDKQHHHHHHHHD